MRVVRHRLEVREQVLVNDGVAANRVVVTNGGYLGSASLPVVVKTNVAVAEVAKRRRDAVDLKGGGGGGRGKGGGGRGEARGAKRRIVVSQRFCVGAVHLKRPAQTRTQSARRCHVAVRQQAGAEAERVQEPEVAAELWLGWWCLVGDTPEPTDYSTVPEAPYHQVYKQTNENNLRALPYCLSPVLDLSTIAVMMLRMSSSDTFSPYRFQDLQPIGGDRAKPSSAALAPAANKAQVRRNFMVGCCLPINFAGTAARVCVWLPFVWLPFSRNKWLKIFCVGSCRLKATRSTGTLWPRTPHDVYSFICSFGCLCAILVQANFGSRPLGNALGKAKIDSLRTRDCT